MSDVSNADRVIQCIKVKHPVNESYHDHKEVMAHACAALEIGIFAWVMSKDGWELVKTGKGILVFLILWFVIHLYLRWELRNRRVAAVKSKHYEDSLNEWGEGGIGKTVEPKQTKRSLFWTFCDYLIPCFRGTPGGQPTRTDWGLFFGECLTTAISWLVVVGILERKLQLMAWAWNLVMASFNNMLRLGNH